MPNPGNIHVEQFVPHPPSRVWQALSTPDLDAKWWAPGDIQPAVGHRFSLDMGAWGKQACEITAVDAERLLAYDYGKGMLNTRITWRLAPEGAGTRLSLDHEGFDLDSPMGKTAHQGMGAGWPSVLGSRQFLPLPCPRLVWRGFSRNTADVATAMRRQRRVMTADSDRIECAAY